MPITLANFPKKKQAPVATAEGMRKACLALVQRRVFNQTQLKDETTYGGPDGREEWKKGEWLGSLFEKQLYDALLVEIAAIPVRKPVQ